MGTNFCSRLIVFHVFAATLYSINIAIADDRQISCATQNRLGASDACAALSNTAHAISAKLDENSRLAADPLVRPSSYAYEILQNKNTSLSGALGEDCIQFLRQLYGQRKTLKSSIMYAASKPISGYKFRSGGNPQDFFHYTEKRAMVQQFHPEIKDRIKAHQQSLADGTYERALAYPKTHGAGIGDRAIYVAEDPESSSNFGSMRVTFFLNPNGRVYPFDSRLPSDIKQELAGRYPELWSHCDDSIGSLIAEDSGIDLLDYTSTPDSDPKLHWFRLIRPHAIEKTELLGQ